MRFVMNNQTLGWVTFALAIACVFAPLLAFISFPVACIAIRKGLGTWGWLSALISGLVLIPQILLLMGLGYIFSPLLYM